MPSNEPEGIIYYERMAVGMIEVLTGVMVGWMYYTHLGLGQLEIF